MIEQISRFIASLDRILSLAQGKWIAPETRRNGRGMKKSWRIWLGVVITLVFLVIAFRGQDFNAIRQALRDFNYIYLIPALALLFTGIWFRAVRWRILLKPVVEVSSRDVF